MGPKIDPKWGTPSDLGVPKWGTPSARGGKRPKNNIDPTKKREASNSLAPFCAKKWPTWHQVGSQDGAKMDKNLWCGTCSVEFPELVTKVHEDYIKAGADVITTNTYASTPISMKNYGLED